jgi:TRAP-type C4-dicarboxylate transport system permease small subunit
VAALDWMPAADLAVCMTPHPPAKSAASSVANPAALAAAEATLGWIETWLARVTGVSILAIMLLIACDVAGRYVFGSPIPWIYDVVSIYFLHVVLYLMASETLRRHGHIALDLKVRFLPPRLWGALQAVAWLTVIAALVATTVVVGQSALESLVRGDVHPGRYEWPVWLEKGIVAIGLALLAIRTVLMFVRYLASGCSPVVFATAKAEGPGHE